MNLVKIYTGYIPILSGIMQTLDCHVFITKNGVRDWMKENHPDMIEGNGNMLHSESNKNPFKIPYVIAKIEYEDYLPKYHPNHPDNQK